MKKTRIILMLSVFILTVLFSQAQNKVKVSQYTFGAIKARHIGPATMSGRISAIDAVDKNPDIIYVGSAGGGVWKTKNGGTTFKPIFDKYCQSIGAVRIDQSNPKVVWIGSGEPWTRNSVSIGDGIYKTTDSGENWKNLGLNKTERIARIIIDPNNSNIVYVAALGELWGPNNERGLYKTSDGGKTWEKVLFVDENTGCCDVIFDPFDSNIIYAGMWQFRRSAHYFNSGGKGSGLYKSTDAGKTWTKLSNDLPKGNLGRIAVSVSPVDSSVYAIIESEKTALYRSKDKGKSWKLMNKTKTVSERPFYFAYVVADPVKKNRVYKPGFNISVSNNGGEHFRRTSVEGGNLHPDVHALYIGKNNNKLLYIGTDGGLFVSRDMGSSWSMIRNLPISQFYHVSADMQKPYKVYGGLQDNGSWSAPTQSSGGINNYDWQSTGFGDGFYVYADQEDPNIIYWQWQGGQIARANLKTKEFRSIKPYKDSATNDLRFNWNTPVVFSRNGKRVYVASQYLYISENKGNSWKKISPDLTTNDPERQKQESTGGLTLDNSTAENHCTVITINESPIDSKIIWVGTDDGNIQITRDAGKTWENVIKNIPNLPEKTWCSYVEPSAFDKAVCYATFDGHKSGDKKSYLYKTTDYGKTWVSLVSKNLETYNHIIKEDLVNPNLLFLGTEFGLYVSIDGGKVWSRLKSEIPKVSIRDMVIHPREQDLILATHGRGILIIDDISPIRQLSNEVINSDITFLKSRKNYIRGMSFGGSYSGDDEFTGRNPMEAAIITYYQKKRHVFGDMYIEIYDNNNKLVDKLPAGKRKGINKVPWFYRKKPPKVPSSPQLANFAMVGPTYAPGTYKVKLIKEDKTYESEIEILLDPNSPHSEEDRKLRHKTLTNAYDLLEKLAFIDKQIVDIYDGAKKTEKEISKNKVEKVKLLADKTNNMHKRLVATKKGNITGEKKIREELSELYGFVLFYKGKPTDSQINSLNYLEKEISGIEKELITIKKKDLSVVNQILLQNKKKEIKITSKEEFYKE